MNTLEQPVAADWRALGTGVRLVVTIPGSLGAARTAVEEVLAEVDRACSRFREDSELSLLNRRSGRPTRVGSLLLRALAEALRAARSTAGDVDPTVGRALRITGYDRDFDEVILEGGPLTLTLAPAPGWERIQVHADGRTVTIPHGVELDLGATAKALAADLAAAAAAQSMGEGGVLVGIGGDIAMAGEPPPGGWVIQVSDDSNDPFDHAAERVAVAGGGVATSSTRVRRWRRGGVEMHHIIDPRTGAPAQTPWRLVTVVADTCVDANTASTAAVVRGHAALPWLESLGLPARLVAQDGGVVHTRRWPVAAGG